MRVVQIGGGFGMEHLEVAERPDPVPGPHDVLVRMRQASLNYRDLLTVNGLYNPRQPLPLVPCSDGMGVVVETGSAVTRFAVGDRVSPAFFRDWIGGEPDSAALKTALGGPLEGTLTQLFCAPEHAFVVVPEHLTDAEAATLTCAGLTAWSALSTQARIGAGETVLVQGTGGVSMFALQFAHMHGARVIATSSSDEKLNVLREEYGVASDDLINYRDDPDWGKTAKALTGGRGVDHVVEVGGAGTLAQSIRAVRPGGTISLIGVLAGGADHLNLVPVLMRNIRIQGVIVGPRDAFEAMNRAISLNRMRPRVDRTFGMEETADAFAYVAAGRHMGKVTIDLA